MKVRELYRLTVQRLQAAGIAEAEIEAGLLLGHLLQCTRTGLVLNAEQLVPASVEQRLHELLDRRLRREPLAYLLGEQEFWSLPFFVTPAVLIPRPETEELLETAVTVLKNHRPQNKTLRLLDLGTGSGVIPVVLALELPHAVIYGLDRSLPALEVARRNARRHGVEDRIRFLASDWFGGLRQQPFFDAILANPPYIDHEVIQTLQPEVRDYEPLGALDGGRQGMEAVELLGRQALLHLQPGGWAFLEIGYDQEELALASFRAAGTYDHLRVRRDYAGQPRILQAQKKAA